MAKMIPVTTISADGTTKRREIDAPPEMSRDVDEEPGLALQEVEEPDAPKKVEKTNRFERTCTRTIKRNNGRKPRRRW